MLEPPEKRIDQLQFPKAFGDRVRRKRAQNRRSKWASKFRGLLAGKSSRKWHKRLQVGEDLAPEARGVAKATKVEAKSRKPSFIEKVLSKARVKKGRKDARRRGREATEPCEDSPWHGQVVRVIRENLHEGKKGRVTTVSKYVTEPGEPEKYRLHMLDETAASKSAMMILDSDEVVVEDETWTKPKPMQLDYRGFGQVRKRQLADELAISAVEAIQEDTLLELGTVAAMMAEVGERVGVPENAMMIEPTIAAAWARDSAEPVKPNEEDEAFLARVRATKHLHIIVHSEVPRHYTYVLLEREGEGVSRVLFKDSLFPPSESAPRQVEKILCNLGVVDASWKCPASATQDFQRDGWSCGLWSTRYLEQSLRGARNEGRTPPASLKFQRERANRFIASIKAARDAREEKATRDAKKAEDESKKKSLAKARSAEILRERTEPVYDTFEEAQEAASKCSKCLPTKRGSKGCRQCMGEWFEMVRTRAPRL